MAKCKDHPSTLKVDRVLKMIMVPTQMLSKCFTVFCLLKFDIMCTKEISGKPVRALDCDHLTVHSKKKKVITTSPAF